MNIPASFAWDPIVACASAASLAFAHRSMQQPSQLRLHPHRNMQPSLRRLHQPQHAAASPAPAPIPQHATTAAYAASDLLRLHPRRSMPQRSLHCPNQPQQTASKQSPSPAPTLLSKQPPSPAPNCAGRIHLCLHAAQTPSPTAACSSPASIGCTNTATRRTPASVAYTNRSTQQLRPHRSMQPP